MVGGLGVTVTVVDGARKNVGALAVAVDGAVVACGGGPVWMPSRPALMASTWAVAWTRSGTVPGTMSAVSIVYFWPAGHVLVGPRCHRPAG